MGNAGFALAGITLGVGRLAFRLQLKFPHHTLTDEEVDRAQQQLLELLGREVGAALRTA